MLSPQKTARESPLPRFILLLNFTPYSFLYLFLYFLSLISLLSISDFFTFWVIIELAILLFIGLCFSLFSLGFSRLIIYFLIQTISSFSLFISFSLGFSRLIIYFLILKLSIFPFHTWFLSLVYRFPNFVIFLASTFHKLPSFLIFSLFVSSNSSFLIFSSLLTLLLSGSFMLISSDFRLLLVSSSIGNNSWFLLSSFYSSQLLLFFIFLYSLFLFFLISFLGLFSSLSLNRGVSFTFLLTLASISGFPPFPLFWVKLYVVYVSIQSLPPFFFFFFLLFAILVLAGYFRFFFSKSVIFNSWEVSFKSN